MKETKLQKIEENFDIWWKKTTNREVPKNFANSYNYDSLKDRYFLLKELFIKHYGKLKIKDIFKYSYVELESEIDRILQSEVLVGRDFDIVVNNKDYLIVHCKTLIGVRKFSWGTKWCTVMEHHFKSYSDKDIYRFINKKEKQENPNYKLSLTLTKKTFNHRSGQLINSLDKSIYFISQNYTSAKDFLNTLNRIGFKLTETESKRLWEKFEFDYCY